MRFVKNLDLLNNFLSIIVVLIVFIFPMKQKTSCAQENVLLVVNADAPDSMALANHYQQLRNIPSNNVVYLPLGAMEVNEKDSGETTTSDEFRDKIYQPIIETIEQRGLDAQIDYITFSCSFPTRISCKPELIKFQKATGTKYSIQNHAPGISLTSAMFFGEGMFSDSPVIFDFHSNWYANLKSNDSRAFSNQARYRSDGTTGDGGVRYRLSTILAVNHPGGSSLAQAKKQLTRSAEADGTQPKGIFYFASNSDPRTTTRRNQFAGAAEALKAMGHQAVIDRFAMPKNQTVVGATLGAPKLEWKNSKSTFAKGAICDNFTSYGGYWRKTEQTHLTEFLNAGAAGAVGTMYEPYTFARKIPTAFSHVHYARGCTLADSIYQTVASPFQLVVVGDPICRPFAKTSPFEVAGITDRSVVDGDLKLTMTPAADSKIDHFLLYVDGLLKQQVEPNQAVQIANKDWAEGFHDVRCVAIDASVGRVRTSKSFGIYVRHGDNPIIPNLKVDAQSAKLSGEFVFRFPAGEAIQAQLWHNSRKLGTFAKDQPLRIKADQLGVGTSKLVAIVRQRDVTTVTVPVEVTVKR
ncbi:MAG: TIGR03790 family protein [Planctomycetota bacterium]